MSLNTDGTLDYTLVTGTGFAYISALALQEDVKIPIEGSSISHNNDDVKYIARLNRSNTLYIDYFIMI